MAKGPEGEFTERVRDEIVADGGVFVPIVAGHMSSGWPDRLCYHRLWYGLIEFKAINGRLSERQRINISQLRRRQPYGAVIARAPNRVEDELGNLIFLFNTGAEMMVKMNLWASGHPVT